MCYFRDILTMFLMAIVGLSCSTDSGEDKEILLTGSWQQEGLEELEINTINVEASLRLVSTNNGIYSKNEDGFFEFGLQDKEVINVVELSEGRYMAATQALDFESGDTTLYKKNDEWRPSMGNYGGDEGVHTWVSNLISSPENQSLLFASGGANIARSNDAGETWESVFQNWGGVGFTFFMAFDHQDENIIWAGGQSVIFGPTLIRSEDGGDTWEFLKVLENGEAAMIDIAIHPKYSNRVLASINGTIIKSKNNGKSWTSTFNEAGIYTFTNSLQNPRIVYASGINSAGRLFFAASGDFGDTWQTVEFENSPDEISVNDMVSVMEGGNEVLYLGTNKGLYSYTIEE